MIYLLRKNIKIKRSSNKLNYTKLELFKIKKKLGLIIFELIILKRIRIYLIFHISLLKLITTNTSLEPIELDKEIIKTVLRNRINHRLLDQGR